MHRTDTWAIAAIAIAQTLIWCGTFYAFPALFVRFEADFGWSKPVLTGALTLAIGASALVSPLVGRLIDRGIGPVVLTGSILLGGLTMLALSQVQTVWQFYLAWAVIGIAMGGGLYEPTFAFMTRAIGPTATRAITLVTLVAGFAGTLSFPLGHYVSEAASWRVAAMTYAGLIILIAAPLMWFGARHFETGFRRATTLRASEGLHHGSAHLRSATFWLLAAGFTLIAINHGVILNHILPLLRERGFDASSAVFAASMIGPMQVVGRIAMMLTAHRTSNRAIVLACFSGITLATLALIAATAVPLFVAGFVLLQGACFGVMSIAKPAITRESMGATNFGAVAGALAAPYLLGIAVAPFFGSLVWEFGGYDTVLVIILLAAIAGGVCVYLATLHMAPRRT
jgi:MFS family permease